MARCKSNTMDVCEVCSLPMGLLYLLDQVMEQAFPGRDMHFLCFEKPMRFNRSDRTIAAPAPHGLPP